MRFSIITVCYNAEKSIRATIESVINQTNKDYEYIIKDGGSTDATLEIIEEYRKKYNISLISGRDKGIYNAMNEAVKSAAGMYIYFLNCGDVFKDEYVLEDIDRAVKDNTEADILYGNMLLCGKEKEEMIDYVSKKRLNRYKIAGGFTVCHQVIFAKRWMFEEKKFDENYKYWADQEWMAYWLSKKINVNTVDRIIVKYDASGVSSNRNNLSVIRKESDCIAEKYTPVFAFFIIPVKKLVRKIIK